MTGTPAADVRGSLFTSSLCVRQWYRLFGRGRVTSGGVITADTCSFIRAPTCSPAHTAADGTSLERMIRHVANASVPSAGPSLFPLPLRSLQCRCSTCSSRAPGVFSHLDSGLIAAPCVQRAPMGFVALSFAQHRAGARRTLRSFLGRASVTRTAWHCRMRQAMRSCCTYQSTFQGAVWVQSPSLVRFDATLSSLDAGHRRVGRHRTRGWGAAVYASGWSVSAGLVLCVATVQ